MGRKTTACCPTLHPVVKGVCAALAKMESKGNEPATTTVCGKHGEQARCHRSTCGRMWHARKKLKHVLVNMATTPSGCMQGDYSVQV